MGRTRPGTEPGIIYSTTYKPVIVGMDVDGDGREEMTVHPFDTDWDDLFLFEYDGSSFVYESTRTHDMPFWSSMTSGDIDGDLNEDLVLFASDSAQSDGTYQVFRRTGPDTLVREPVVAGGPATDLFDIDGDGDLDPIGGRTMLTNHFVTGAVYCTPPANSTGQTASLSVTGSSSLSRSDLVLHSTDLPALAPTLVVLAGRADVIPVGSSYLYRGTPVSRPRAGRAAARCVGRSRSARDPSRSSAAAKRRCRATGWGAA
ncbi:MAG: VCBS repeat-containing protein [bacterium]|nr:VCBS repeat-containing protein [bacterium]